MSKRENLINQRKKLHLTQDQVAATLNITKRHYQALEAGTSMGSVVIWEHLKKLLRAKTIDFLLEQKDEPSL